MPADVRSVVGDGYYPEHLAVAAYNIARAHPLKRGSCYLVIGENGDVSQWDHVLLPGARRALAVKANDNPGKWFSLWSVTRNGTENVVAFVEGRVKLAARLDMDGNGQYGLVGVL